MFKDLLTMAYYLDAFYASVGENPDLCLLVPCKRKKKKEVVVPIVASSMAAVLVLLFIFSALVIYRRKRKGGTSFFIFCLCNCYDNSLKQGRLRVMYHPIPASPISPVIHQSL